MRDVRDRPLQATRVDVPAADGWDAYFTYGSRTRDHTPDDPSCGGCAHQGWTLQCRCGGRIHAQIPADTEPTEYLCDRCGDRFRLSTGDPFKDALEAAVERDREPTLPGPW